MVADEMHARTDGFTSFGVVAGFPLADPIVGLPITATILVVLRGAGRDVFRRLMDGVEPELVDQAEATLAATQACSRWSRYACAGSAIGCGPKSG